MTTYLVTIGLILAIGLFGIAVDRIYRTFAQRHPQLGPFRDSDGGCGCCSSSKTGCSGGECSSR